ncbi:MAG: phage tail family protein [Lachnospiraceae bacterium]|nr:phage tail family protein [Lachnospiraceae bacterium]
MKINGEDISIWNARQWTVDIEHNEIKNDSEWVRGSPVPAFFSNTLDFKTIKVTLLVKGQSREEIEKNRSDIVAELIDPVILELDMFDHKFKAILIKSSVTENVIKRMHQLVLEFSGYEFGDEISSTFSGTDTITIENPGNLETPVILEIVPQIGASTVVFEGLCRDPETKDNQDITIRELSKDKKIILNSETGLITEDGANKFKDVDLWELPSLLPGTNIIKCSTKNLEITVKFKPMFI